MPFMVCATASTNPVSCCQHLLPVVQGVELTHSNLAYQMRNLGYFCPIKAGDRTLSLLPPWHIYERAAAYYVFSRAGSQVTSLIGTLGLECRWSFISKLSPQQQLVLMMPALQVYTTIRNFKDDLTRYPPNHFVCVPLVLDTLYNRARLLSLCPGPLH